MYVYRGKLNWDNYALNEALTVILPSDIELGELVSVHWQWTIDDSGSPKENESITATISRITHTGNEKNIRFFQDQDYKFDAVLGPSTESLDMTMTNSVGDNSSMTLQLSYSDNTSMSWYHIYVGKLDWYWYAVEDMLVVAVLSSLREGDPICAYWQWTVNGSGVPKVNRDSQGVINSTAASRTGKKIGFFYGEYYRFDGEVAEDGERMNLVMRNNSGDESRSITLWLSSKVL